MPSLPLRHSRLPALLRLRCPPPALALALAFAVPAWTACGAAHAQSDSSPAAPALVDYSLEQLADLVVSSVSRQDTRLAEAPASIYLITGADIRRAGATNLADALRLAPNLQVAQSDSHNWAVTARGFGSVLANKLLVLVDGRSIYSPLFSGVFWDTQDVLMEDIERIEVISGPGATIWGANAVNGVINIITRNAADTVGELLVAGAGNRNDLVAARHGGALANGGHYRVYAQFHDGAPLSASDAGWRRRQAGMRADWDGAVHDVTVSADVYQGTTDGVNGRAGPLAMAGANAIARVTSQLADGSRLRLQAYLDHVERNQPGVGGQRLDTVDLEAQHSVQLGQRNHLTWGGGYRQLRDRFENGPFITFAPLERSSRLANLFAQDEVSLREALRLTAGMRFEHNDYTGWEWLPNLHLGWNLASDRLLWAGISRTVRAPSRLDRDLQLLNPGGTPPLSIAGGPDFDSETARVVEVGYRAQPLSALTISATVFHSAYQRLRTLEPGAAPGPQFRNLGEGSVRGVELWSQWLVSPGWRLASGLVVQDVRTGVLPGSADLSSARGLASNDPSHYWSLRSSHDLSEHLQADFALRHVGSLPQPAVPAYTELDARFAWQPDRRMELSLSGQNLLHAGHPEFGPAATRQRIERTLALRMVLRF